MDSTNVVMLLGTGQTTCVSGYACVANGAYYSQCVPGTANTQPAASSSRTTSVVVSGPTATPISGGVSGTGKTTRYWDCCKPSCAWTGKVRIPLISSLCDLVLIAIPKNRDLCPTQSTHVTPGTDRKSVV